jgi:two-component system, OmpR family, KDP operon response regulator KdpE
MNAEATTPPGALVLVVEDELAVQRFLRTHLDSQGYRVVESTTGREALRAATQYVPDVILLDLGLPDVDGLQVLRELRSWYVSPILVLTARGQERAKVEALDAGADDYVTKPFSLPELLARIRVALRHAARGSISTDGTLRSGALSIDLDARRVLVADHEVHLTPIEYKLLTTLARNAGRVVTHRQLLHDVWGPQSTEQTQYLRVYMTHLRRKLEREVGGTRIFDTEAGVGYRLREES